MRTRSSRARFTGVLNREIAVYITRDGEVVDVSIGTDRDVELRDYRLRRNDVETCHPIRIGDDSWLGGGVVVLPGVTIGARCVIGAGSVVIRDIPDDSVAVGNPARVVRRLATPSGPASEA